MKWPLFGVGALLVGHQVEAMIQPGQLLQVPRLSLAEARLQSQALESPFYNGTFEQLLDHENPHLGTFTQRYWVSQEFWGGPGSPVIFFNPGEADASVFTGYLTNKTITGLFAQAVQGAVVIMEHRYWGGSSPFADLTTANLQYLTLDNAVKDNTYFANNVRFPFDTNGSSSPAKAPWVFSGGSYSGALSAWTYSLDPGTFWAYHASSATVQTIGNFWEYYDPIRKGMPSNCSADVQKVVEHIDHILMHGKQHERQAIKSKFGLESVSHDDDFVSTLQSALWLWQGNSFTTGYSAFFQFCDYIENAVPEVFTDTLSPGPKGVGLEKALQGYALWTKQILLPGYCNGYDDVLQGAPRKPLASAKVGDDELWCANSYNKSSALFTDTSLDNIVLRQWTWLKCNEAFEFSLGGSPRPFPSLVSRILGRSYWNRQCSLMFPPEDGHVVGIQRGADAEEVVRRTKGWSLTDTERLLWVNGEYDPWLDSTVSSDFRPGGPLKSTPEAPVLVIPGGIHCSDLIAAQGQANKGAQKVIDEEIAIIKDWVDAYYQQ